MLNFVDMMLATGKRIGENSAITWDALDLDAGTVEIRGTVVRIRGEGLRIKLKPEEPRRVPQAAIAVVGGGNAASPPDRRHAERMGCGIYVTDRDASGPEQYAG